MHVAVDSDGNVYVADTSNHRIQKFTSEGTYIRTWGGFGSGDGQFNYAHGVAVDTSGNVFVSDSQVVPPPDNAFVSQNGNGRIPSGNAFVSQNGNGRIQKFTNTGIFTTRWGSQGSADGQLLSAQGIAIKSATVSFLEERVYVADTGNSRIQVFKPRIEVHP
jgi:DNA-binding beta-propeller fold protein YncE